MIRQRATALLIGGIVAMPLWVAPLAAASPPANPYVQRLESLDPLRQKAVLRQAIVDSNQRCGRIERTGRIPPFKNLVGWSAHCNPGGDYLVYIGPDGSAQVRSCTDARMLKLAGCPALPPVPPK